MRHGRYMRVNVQPPFVRRSLLYPAKPRRGTTDQGIRAVFACSEYNVFMCEHMRRAAARQGYTSTPRVSDGAPMEARTVPVSRLAEFYRQAGFRKHASLAAAISNHPLAHELGVGVSRVSVGRYLAGVTTPDLTTTRLIVAVLSERLTRPVTLSDAWPALFAPPVAERALRYERSLRGALECVAELTGRDADGEGRQSLLGLPLVLPAISEAITSWRYGLPDATIARGLDTGGVSLADVARIRDDRAWFASLDHARGGGRVRAAVTSYLHEHVVPLLRGSYTDDVGRELLAASAEILELAGFSSALLVSA